MNLAANLAARLTTAVLTLLLAPLYARILGMEAYGLVGIFIAVQGLFALFDFGLGTALNRELALDSTRGHDPVQRAVLVRTFEITYSLIGVAVGASFAGLAPILRSSWVNAERLDPETVTTALVLMALAFTLQWPSNLYIGGLLGLQRHVLANSLQMVFGLARGVGALAVVIIYPSVVWFFAWHAVVAAAQTLALRTALTTGVRGTGARGFHVSALVRTWRFAAGMTGIAVTSALLTQVDKILLTKLLPLDGFGRYALCATAASGLYYLASPVYAVAFPALTRLSTGGPQRDLARFYHLASQLSAVAVIPLATMLVVFPSEVLFVWTGDTRFASEMSGVLALLAAGTALNALMMIPYALQLAHGWTGLAFWSNLIGIAILAPLLVAGTRAWGVSGAAACWLALNLGYLTVQPFLLHRRYLSAERAAWMRRDIGMPMLAVSLTALGLRWILPAVPSRGAGLVGLAFCGTVLAVVAIASAPVVRQGAWRLLRFREPLWT